METYTDGVGQRKEGTCARKGAEKNKRGVEVELFCNKVFVCILTVFCIFFGDTIVAYLRY